MVTDDPSGPRHLRGPYAKTATIRSSILQAAFEVFAESGYRSGSLRHVADRVGMSEAGLLHHFPSKSALLAAVLELRDDRARERFDVGDVDGRATIRGLVAMAEYNSTIPGVVELFTILAAEATSSEHPAHEFFCARYGSAIATVTRALQQIQDNGGLRGDIDAHETAQRAIALWDGLQIQWLLDRHAVDVASHLRDFFDSVLVDPI